MPVRVHRVPIHAVSVYVCTCGDVGAIGGVGIGVQALSLMEQAVECVESAMQLESGTIYRGTVYAGIYLVSLYTICLCTV
jgi:hypothetical protein